MTPLERALERIARNREQFEATAPQRLAAEETAVRNAARGAAIGVLAQNRISPDDATELLADLDPTDEAGPSDEPGRKRWPTFFLDLSDPDRPGVAVKSWNVSQQAFTVEHMHEVAPRVLRVWIRRLSEGIYDLASFESKDGHEELIRLAQDEIQRRERGPQRYRAAWQAVPRVFRALGHPDPIKGSQGRSEPRYEMEARIACELHGILWSPLTKDQHKRATDVQALLDAEVATNSGPC